MLNLTKQEKTVILFLLASLIVGCAVIYYKDRIVSCFGPQERRENIIAKKAPAIININKATQKELESLPHIGPSLAKRIIEYRTDKGMFLLKEDLRKVKGISLKTYKDLESLIATQ